MSKALKRALAALRSDRHVDALDALLEVWTAAPSPALAACIESASAMTRVEVPGIRGKTKVAIAAWAKAAKKPRATEVPALLDAFADVLWRDAAARIAMMRAWRDDPRVDELCVRMLETLPYRSTSKPFYVALLALASRIRLPALVVRIGEARQTIGQLMSPTLGDWLERRVDELVEDVRVETKFAKHDLKEIEKLLAKATKSAGPREELGDLLDAVYEDPDDTSRRLVYADALLERDDLRGELITLQCQPALTPVQQRRANALVKAHGISWLGPLAAIVKKDFAFERGFLAACTIDSNKGTRIMPLVGDPAWSTVHTLADSAQIALHPVMRSLRTLEFRPNRTRQREGLDGAWRELLAGRKRPLQCLHYTDFDSYEDFDEQFELLSRCDALPALRELSVGRVGHRCASEMLHTPVATRLSTLGFIFEPYDDIPAGLLQLVVREGTVPRFVVRHPSVTIELEREGASYRRARFAFHRGFGQACSLIASLPPAIRELRVTTPRNVDRRALVPLASAASGLKLDVREIS